MSAPGPNTPRHAPIGPFLWLGFLALVAVIVWLLWRSFPDRLSSTQDYGNLIVTLAILTLVSSSIVYARRLKLGETLRNIALWLAIAAVLALGYTFQNELNYVGARVRSELLPGTALSAGGEMIVTAGADGHFYVNGEVNGVSVRFLVDTGASETVLSPADAARAGIDLGTLQFTGLYQTANGVGRGAPFRLMLLAIGAIELSDMPVSINEAAMPESLLGMSFLRRLRSFEFEGRQLVLRWR
jgi:aspartyl protease family protein